MGRKRGGLGWAGREIKNLFDLIKNSAESYVGLKKKTLAVGVGRPWYEKRTTESTFLPDVYLRGNIYARTVRIRLSFLFSWRPRRRAETRSPFIRCVY
jgi:hypothetical protein